MANSAPATESDRSMVQLHVRNDAHFASHGETVLALSDDGFIEDGPEQGLFVRQTRVLSRYRCRLGGRKPLSVARSNVRQDRWMGYYILAAPGADGDKSKPQVASQHTLELRISRVVGEGMHEDYDLANYTREPVQVRLTLEIDGDFADQDETRDGRKQQGTVRRGWQRMDRGALLRLEYRARHQFSHHGKRGSASTHRVLDLRILNADSQPRRVGRFVHFDIELPPQGRWHACLVWEVQVDGERLPAPGCAAGSNSAGPNSMGTARDDVERHFQDAATAFTSGESETLAPVVVDAIKQARRDLLSLRMPRFDHGLQGWVPAAGVPMYVALFGRDTLNTAIQSAPLGPELLTGTLLEMARWQGRKRDDWRDEQPGRILHEAHPGPLKQLGFNPKDRYYGSLTSSLLFPIALARLWHWTADREKVAPLIEPALRALAWAESCRVATQGGFYAVRTRSREGIANQTWKDSDDALVSEDGQTAEHPVATCEEQGLVFAAKQGLAGVLAAFGRAREAQVLEREARELHKRFNDAYWMEQEGCFALGIDARGRLLRSVASNALHCLPTGIADPALAPRTLERLFEPDMFNGWGIRTLSSRHPAYNPYAYHRGTIWPVEHGPFALGAQRYGDHARTAQVCRAQFELASIFDYRRLPECLSGHPRDAAHPFPALYPAANAPQAWSSATLISLVQALLGLQPAAPMGLLLLDPHLPDWLPTLTLHHLRVGTAEVTLRFDRQPDGRTRHCVVEQRGSLRVVEATLPPVALSGRRLRAWLREQAAGAG